MNSSKMYDKVFAIFGTVMVFFYFGLAIFVLTTKIFDIDKAMRIILAVPLFIYAIYRVFISYEKIRDSFFSNKDGDE
ncbi:MAG: hypothetical protein KBB24_03625 [Bacteroidales bacterium]|jgi:hypothetical protein|nr:hypothetical protein [Bacteroidales bacterium]MDX9926049.1 hypothetical protein [Bacteroidales bacterium]HNX83123.1 hypothetical protein [Bacteroidales bacterium]HOC47656.1 hypothetical protein [Bacteroidales bacterium]HPS98063.1 hypothetical protein [Bacteroidales bacterium]